ncbi:MAG: carbon monoxide dehydrogenase subunit G [Micromonosporaceae bacterium]|nr:carbon monoxide dehydrogenase subunit G [Micromonosporaceae bacterium]
MRITGEAGLRAPAGEVFKALHDPEVLVRTIPGCRRLDLVGPDSYTMVVHAGVAAVKGEFAGEVRLSDPDPPHGFTLHASGSGAPGTVTATVDVTLVEVDGSTVVSYAADAEIGGMIGGVGQRLLGSVATKTAAEFFAAVDAEMTGAVGPAAVEPTRAEPAQKRSFVAPVRPRPAPATFLAGAIVGAAAALLGALVGGLVATRAGRR